MAHLCGQIIYIDGESDAVLRGDPPLYRVRSRHTTDPTLAYEALSASENPARKRNGDCAHTRGRANCSPSRPTYCRWRMVDFEATLKGLHCSTGVSFARCVRKRFGRVFECSSKGSLSLPGPIRGCGLCLF